MTVHVSVPVDETAKADLDAWAEARGLPVGAMLSMVVEAYVQEQREIVEAVARGRAAIAAGEVVDHADVVAEFDARRAEWRLGA